ncbi:MAG: bifunctional folylpolyglutamate synthase/dihydrofolate synthase [Planctomycetaceae bacterium]|nr:bifunctional folylpolyglutamate synthase/dihydrofolate synthase [Planctomycetaceae bacterium]
MTTYHEAIEFLLNRTNFERKHASTFQHRDFKLDRMRALLKELDDPHVIPAVHIAGTKGKGSTAHMVAACLQASGFRTGLFTSPHLENYEERIRIDGLPLEREDLVHYVEILQRATETLQSRDSRLNPTFFELTTALAWIAFRAQEVQIVVLEVGLGGRLDSTNLCHPLVTAITSIGFDHTQQLGNTIEKITAEKAGILKSGIPVVSGCTRDNARKVVRQKADDCSSRLWELQRDILAETIVDERGNTYHNFQTPHRKYENLRLRILGAHQVRNLAVALGILDCLHQSGFEINHRSIPTVIGEMTIPGRQEILSHQPLVLLDVAHNEDSNQALIESLQQLPPTTGNRILIFGSSRDKNYAQQLEGLVPLFQQVILTSSANSDRSCRPEEMFDSISPVFQNRLSVVETVPSAMEKAIHEVGRNGLLVVSGSFYLAGEARCEIKKYQKKRQPHENVVA